MKKIFGTIATLLLLTGMVQAQYNSCMFSKTTNCSVASGPGFVLTQYPSNTWPYVGLGVPITIAAAPTTGLPGLLEVLTTNEDCSTNIQIFPLGSGTNGGSVIFSGWTATGNPSSGSGLTATFSPTNLGAGSVVFFLAYNNASFCGGTNFVTFTNNFTVVSNANLALAENMMDVAFGGNPPVKTGFAAVGMTPSDYWNPYGTSYGGLTYGIITNLLWVDGVPSGASLLVSNAPNWFQWTPLPNDNMYRRFSYINNNQLSVTVSNLPAGTYDFYVYAHGYASVHNQSVDITSAGVDFGAQTTASAGTNWETTHWQEGQQYVLYWGVPVVQNSNVVITVTNGGGGISSDINGIQIIQQYGFTVASLTPTNNANCILFNSNATLQTWYIPVSSNPAITNLQVVGTPSPFVPASSLPEGWSLNGARTNSIFLSITNVATYTVVCSVGTSAITNIIEVGGAVYSFSNNVPGIVVNCLTNTSHQLVVNAVTNTTPFPFVTAPNSARSDSGNVRVGTVSRIHVGTNPVTDPSTVIGEYFSVPADQGGDPSRTTVDRYGNVWVGNRAADGTNQDDPNGLNMGTITEFGVVIGGIRGNRVPYDTNLGNYLGLTNWSFVPTNTGEFLEPPFIYNTCIDRDGDGFIHTSAGTGDVLPWPANDSLVDGLTNAADEVILRYVRTMPQGVRSIPIDANNNFWAGSCNGDHNADGYQEFIDTSTGVPVTGRRFYFGPGGYGGVISGDGSIWSQGRGGDDAFNYTPGMLRFFPQAGIPPVLIGGVINQAATGGNLPSSYYGIGIDPLTDNPWTAGNGANGAACFSTNGSWEEFAPPGVNGSARGIFIDARSNVWMAADGKNGVFHMRTTGDFVGFIPFNSLTIRGQSVSASTPLGVCMDSQGMVWAVCQGSGSAVRIDPNTGPTTNINGTNFAVGAAVEAVNLTPGGGPYTYSDMTGYVSLSTTQPAGLWDFVQDSGETNMLWTSLVESTNVPASGASILTEVRAADRVTDLPSWPFRTVTGTNIPVGLKGRYMEVRVNLLRSFGFTNGPALNTLTLTWGGNMGSALQITNQPHNAMVPPGSNVVFTVGVSIPAGHSVSYQWRTNDANVSNGGFISGATTSALTVSNAQYNNAGLYSVVVSDLTSTNTVLNSAEARLHILGNSPTNVSGHTGVTISGPQTIGQSATFTSFASASSNSVPGGEDKGVAPIFYQWRFGQNPLTNAGAAGVCVLTNLTGASNVYATQFTLNNLQCTNQGFYSVVFWNQYGELLSPNAQLSPGGTPTVSISPSFTQVTTPSQAVTLTATVSCQSWIAAQWYVTGPEGVKRPIPGATNVTYTLPNPISCANIGTYFFDIFDSSRFPIEASAVVTSVSHGAMFTTMSNISMVLVPNPDGNANWTYTNQISVNGGSTWQAFPPNGPTLTMAMNGSQDGDYFRVIATQTNHSGVVTNTAVISGALNSSSSFGPDLVLFSMTNATGNILLTAAPPSQFGPWVSWNWSFADVHNTPQFLPANVSVTNAQGINSNVCTITNVTCGDLGSFIAQVGDACGDATQAVTNILTETPPALSTPATTVTNLILQLVPTNISDGWIYTNQVSTNGGLTWQAYSPNGSTLTMAMNGNQDGEFFRILATDPQSPNATSAQTATLLGDGRLLIAGGLGNEAVPSDNLSNAQIYASSPWGSWMTANPMNVPRNQQTATLLPSGKVLVAGGDFYLTPVNNVNIALTNAELYDPNTGAWTITGSLNVARYDHTATLLGNGAVLVAGGTYDTPFNLIGYLNSSELYDPAAQIWLPTAGNLNTARFGHTADLLPDGTVLVAGGLATNEIVLSSVEIYDPKTQRWTLTNSMHTARVNHTETVLTNGQILVAGGENNIGIISGGAPEFYSPSSGTWTNTGSMITARYGHTAALLPNGQVLAVGGLGTGGILGSAELYNPITGTWTNTGSLNIARYNHTETLLPNGQVLVVGGNGTSGSALDSAELYNPSTGQWTIAQSLDTASVTASLNSSSSNGPALSVLAIQGGTANLTIIAQQPPTLGPWIWNWTLPSGATDTATNNGQCVISNIACGDFGSYTGQVSDSCGNSAQSATTVLNETLPGQTSPLTTMRAMTLTLHPLGDGSWNCAAYGNGTFVAIQSGNNGAAYSGDGVGWAATAMPSSNNWESVAFGIETNATVTNGLFAAIAQGTNGAFSYDGVNWQPSRLSSSGNWASLTFGTNNVGSNIFVAVGQGTNAAYSYTGTNWLGSPGLPVSETWSGVAYGIDNNGSNIFVAVAQGNNNSAYSYDGINWTSSVPGLSFGSGEGATCIAYGNNSFVAISGSGHSDTATSSDGINWTVHSTALPASDTWISVAFGPSSFMAITSDNDQGATSGDGVNWNPITLPAPNLYSALAAKPTGSGVGYVAVGNANSAAFLNPNTSTWSPTTMATSDIWNYTNQISTNGGLSWQNYPPNGPMLTMYMDGGVQGGDYFRIIASDAMNHLLSASATVSLNNSSSNGPALGMLSISNATADVTLTAQQPNGLGPWNTWTWKFETEAQELAGSSASTLSSTNDSFTVTNVACGVLGYYTANVSDACGTAAQGVTSIIDEVPPSQDEPETTMQSFVLQFTPTNSIPNWIYTNQISTNGGVTWMPYLANGSSLTNLFVGDQDGYYFRILATSGTNTASVTLLLNEPDFSPLDPQLDITGLTNGSANLVLTAQPPVGLGPWTIPTWSYFDTFGAPQSMPGNATVNGTTGKITIAIVACGDLGYFEPDITDACGNPTLPFGCFLFGDGLDCP